MCTHHAHNLYMCTLCTRLRVCTNYCLGWQRWAMQACFARAGVSQLWLDAKFNLGRSCSYVYMYICMYVRASTRVYV